MQNKALLPQALVLLTDVGYLVKILQFSGSQRISNYLTFQSVDFERIRGWSFQKRVVRPKFDIYVLLAITFWLSSPIADLYIICMPFSVLSLKDKVTYACWRRTLIVIIIT
jgi:hypothetical protein